MAVGVPANASNVPNMKENNGRAARKKFTRKLSTVLCVFLGAMGILLALEHQFTSRNNNNNNNNGAYEMEDGMPKKKRMSLWNKLRKGGKQKAKSMLKLSEAATVHRTSQEFNRILLADLNLIDLEVDNRELRNAAEDSYDGVYGIFCKLNFQVHKDDPSAVPMFRDIVAHSPNCENTKVKAPLKDIATLAREMDAQTQQQQAENTGDVAKALNITGVVFHESRCGSTLVANMLIGMDPQHHRVYSESPPPVTALRICGDDMDRCTIDQAAAVVRDTLYLMSRTNDPQEQRAFFKIQSVGSRHIHVFRHAFPTTPWIFVYRDPVQVMMSHLAYGYRKANCLRSLHQPPTTTQQLIKDHGYKSPSQLAPEEFCAAHLATITESALHNLQSDSLHGHAVNYEQLPKALYKHILPKHWGVAVSDAHVENILQTASKYSKGRGDSRKQEWQEDSQKKEEKASDEVRDAAKIFMQSSYEALQSLSLESAT